MENEFRERRTKSHASTRSIMDFAMGFFYIAGAFFLIFSEKVGYSMEHFDKTFRYIFGVLCAVYGTWRIYRGFKKDYY
ncbi:MAG TPA: hypothetical protein VF623_01465 [Segetibacter sp.]